MHQAVDEAAVVLRLVAEEDDCRMRPLRAQQAADAAAPASRTKSTLLNGSVVSAEGPKSKDST
jgi:hypothetical protein